MVGAKLSKSRVLLKITDGQVEEIVSTDNIEFIIINREREQEPKLTITSPKPIISHTKFNELILELKKELKGETFY